MLDGLDKVDWSKLAHAYGAADDVPHNLRNLASPDARVRNHALESLHSSIWHQGTVYEATAYAVPFLIDLLGVDDLRVKADILRLLQAIATGTSYLAGHGGLDFYRGQRDTPEFQRKLAQEMAWVKAARAAVTAGVSAYLARLTDDDPNVRLAAADLLAECSESWQTVEPALLQRIAGDPHPGVRAACIETLGTLLRLADVPQTDRLLAWMRAANEPLPVRLAAALQIMRLSGQAFHDEVRAVFDASINADPSIFADTPYSGGTVVSAISDALNTLPRAQLDWLLEFTTHPQPALRSLVIYEVLAVCARWRWASEIAAPRLRDLLADPDEGVRLAAVVGVADLGSAATIAEDALARLTADPSTRIRDWATKALRAARGLDQPFALESWAGRVLDWPDDELLETLDEQLQPNAPQSTANATRNNVMTTLGARKISAAVPLLKRALDHNDHWARVHAALALAQILPDQPELVMPTLLEELRGRPAGLLVADCLGGMGAAARDAVPALRRVADSQLRLVESASKSEWIALDEAFQAAARSALAKIERAL